MITHKSIKLLYLLLFSCVFSIWGTDDEAQANGYDSAWQSQWIAHAQAVLAPSVGKTAGLVLMIGDSITHFSYNAIWPQQGLGKTSDDLSILAWCHAADVGLGQNDATSDSGWYLSTANTSGNRGMTASAGIDTAQLLSGTGLQGISMPDGQSMVSARSIVADGGSYPFNLRASTVVNAFANAQFAVCEVGTNDVNTGRSAASYIANITSLVTLLENNRVVPILCTLPPRPDAYTNGLIIGYNQALYTFAQSHGLALIDFNAEILIRRPGVTWEGTLIISGDVHPTHTGAGYDCTSDPYADGGDPQTHTTGAACLNVGFLLRSWLIVQKLKQVKSQVIDPTLTGYGTDGWLNYGHDSRRTSVSGGQAIPPYTRLWEYQPIPPVGRHLLFVSHVIASASGLFVGWAADDQLDGYNIYDTGSVGMDAVTLAGQKTWSFDSIASGQGSDRNLAHWPTASQKFIWEIDDGLFRWAFDSPQRVLPSLNADATALWGDLTWQNSKIYGINGLHAEGRGIELACWNEDSTTAWASVLMFSGSTAYNVSDCTQGLVVDSSTVLYAPQYRSTPGQSPSFGMGIYAFDANKGTPLYVTGVAPLSKMSVSGGQIYLLESLNSLQYLTARQESTGHMLWHVQVSNGSRQAPVVFSDRVVTASSGDITAYRPTDGTVLWSVSLAGANIGDETLSLAPAPSVPTWTPVVRGPSVNGLPTFHLQPSTSIAGSWYIAANGPIGSVVVVTGAQVTILDAMTGLVRGTFTAQGIRGPIGSVRDPVIVGNRLYMVTDQNTVLAYAGQ